MSENTDPLPDWAPLVHGLRTRFRTRDFAAGLELVTAFAAEAEAANHHPDLTLRYGTVDVLLYSHDAGGVTDRDRRLAARFSEIAREREVSANPGESSVVELGLDTADAARIAPFWSAVLGAEIQEDDGDLEIRAHGADAILWFQHTEPHETPRQRFHLDVWVDPREARGRIEAALAAGGRLASAEHAPSFWVLADPDGNHACICTATGRP
ncbi:4a-hydroxytetrahydrobiopterin dehydratase [Tsukamurella pulmonis]|uniref:VOC family protein n=1 Tax=Tsukamurella pulmonis TaxID=47312 RepID=UPI00079B7111|nr:VOC family protein [Tsukamurella pulmonis]KXP13077.1 4a-hydroxytetrahydrobiopterin dehydratase [Tsukamurella pulmonis]RDH13014.1 4a-hydroxytetrahydrobiopterin dehydratase [Tsukamurella pulmonis]